MKRTTLYFSLAALFALNIHAQNAVITWNSGGVGGITGDSDIYSGQGTLLGTASPYLLQNGGAGASLTLANGDIVYGDSFSSFTTGGGLGNYSTSMGNPNTADSNYNLLLEGAVDTGLAEGGNLTFGGLTFGNTYVVELWAEDLQDLGYRQWENFYVGSTGNQSSAVTFPSDGSDNTYSLNDYNGPNGNWITGTFVANATTEEISLNTYSSVNADRQGQVNLVMVWTVPEPSTLALMAAGGGALMLLRARRRS
jgi:PEP-CTERM motif